MNRTEEEFYKMIKDIYGDTGAMFVVRLRCKYTQDKDWEVYNIVLDYHDNRFTWDWDWNEGQQDVEILDCVNIDNLWEYFDLVPREEWLKYKECIQMDEKYKVRALYPHYLYEALFDTLTEAEVEYHKIIREYTESPFGRLKSISIVWGSTIIKESEVSYG